MTPQRKPEWSGENDREFRAFLWIIGALCVLGFLCLAYVTYRAVTGL